MFKIKYSVFAILLFSIAYSYPQSSHSEMFKSSEFISWQRDSQEYFIRISIGMAVLIADQNDKTQAACLSDWFGKDEAAAYNRILETMKRFPDYHPRGVILAVAEKQCGPFIYAGR